LAIGDATSRAGTLPVCLAPYIRGVHRRTLQGAVREGAAHWQAVGSLERATHTPSSHCNVDVHVFCTTTDPESVRQAPFGSTPWLQLAGSLERATHEPLSHWRVSVHVFCA
jgi:hypothetical protein